MHAGTTAILNLNQSNCSLQQQLRRVEVPPAAGVVQRRQPLRIVGVDVQAARPVQQLAHTPRLAQRRVGEQLERGRRCVVGAALPLALLLVLVGLLGRLRSHCVWIATSRLNSWDVRFQRKRVHSETATLTNSAIDVS